MDSQIPNIYNYGGVNTGLLRTSKDNGVNWDSIQMTNGVYTVSGIEAAILASITTYWTSATDPGLALRYNTQTKIVYVDLDSTKLAVAGQVCIDFAPTGSSLMTLLGFTTPTSFNTDGIHTANTYSAVSWIGNSISCQLYGLGSITIENGTPNNEFFRIPLSSAAVSNEYVFPTSAIVSPWITLNPMSQLQMYSFKFVGSNSRQCLLLEGQVNVIFELREVD
jgi:hypothetical protein